MTLMNVLMIMCALPDDNNICGGLHVINVLVMYYRWHLSKSNDNQIQKSKLSQTYLHSQVYQLTFSNS